MRRLLLAFVFACGATESVPATNEDAGADANADVDASSSATGDAGDASAADGPRVCKPRTCPEQGIECGAAGDGCGGSIDCGNCKSGKRCGAPGVSSKCVDPLILVECTAKTCEELAIECGPANNGCNGTISSCGDCEAGTQCGAGLTRWKCVAPSSACTPLTCAELGIECGPPTPNGCGGFTASCGECADNFACKYGKCVRACTPWTCEELEVNCGWIADGCGKAIDCGVCPAGFACGVGGKPNVCAPL
jgi:hypothetical protein